MSFSTRGIRGCKSAFQGEPKCRSVQGQAGQGFGESRGQFVGMAPNAGKHHVFFVRHYKPESFPLATCPKSRTILREWKLSILPTDRT